MKPLDLIIDHKNQRMRVVATRGTTRFGVVVHQEVQAVTLQPGSIEDKVPLNIDPLSLEMAGWRNFTNPLNPEAAGVPKDDALANLLGRYGY